MSHVGQVLSPQVLELECPICKDSYCLKSRKPMLWCSCGQTICSQCIHAIETSNRSANRGNRVADKCPLCNNRVRDAPILNRVLCDLIEASTAAPARHPSGTLPFQCDICLAEELLTEPVCYCDDCKHWLCQHHERALQHRGHQTVYSTKSILSNPELKQRVGLRFPVDTCVTHNDTVMLRWCYNCNKPICKQCVLSDHVAHKHSSFDEAWVACTQKVGEMIHSVESQIAHSKRDVSVIGEQFSEGSVRQHSFAGVAQHVEKHIASKVRTETSKFILDLKALATSSKFPLQLQYDSTTMQQRNLQQLIDTTKQMVDGRDMVGLAKTLIAHATSENQGSATISLPTRPKASRPTITTADVSPLLNEIDSVLTRLFSELKTRVVDDFGVNEEHKSNREEPQPGLPSIESSSVQTLLLPLGSLIKRICDQSVQTHTINTVRDVLTCLVVPSNDSQRLVQPFDFLDIISFIRLNLDGINHPDIFVFLCQILVHVLSLWRCWDAVTLGLLAVDAKMIQNKCQDAMRSTHKQVVQWATQLLWTLPNNPQPLSTLCEYFASANLPFLSLSLHEAVSTPSDLVNIGLNLNKFRHLVHFNLSGHSLSYNSEILAQLGQLSQMKGLVLSKCHINNKGLERLCQAISGLYALESLDLSYNQLDNSGLNMLANRFTRMPKLNHLDLNGNQLDAIRPLCVNLHMLRSLISLVLPNAMLLDVASHVKSNPSQFRGMQPVRCLNDRHKLLLHSPSYYFEYKGSLGPPQGHSITTLVLGSFEINEQYIETLTNLFTNIPLLSSLCLEKVTFAQTGVNKYVMEDFIAMLVRVKSSQLRYLYLIDTPLNVAGCQSLFLHLHQFTHLVELIVRRVNMISCVGPFQSSSSMGEQSAVISLVKSIETMKHLRHLDVRGNGLDVYHCAMLIEAVGKIQHPYSRELVINKNVCETTRLQLIANQYPLLVIKMSD